MLSTIIQCVSAAAIGRAMLMAALASVFTVAQAQDANAILIKNFMFSPMSLTVKTGSTVTWKNLDSEPHTVVSEAGIFHSNALDQDDTYQFRFDKPGVYNVYCGIHPHMKATVTVR
ncbi:cupredoxin family copper-binding protein [Cupriavidus basilensis]|uniref:Cupredoxin family copper-binding protein n=1 Tax=Cupriavidus basilensis TaxID=68895 RepID=A0ABT6ASP2_9BURK|nr:cupredoxin family copper-binding protein [Cupriavidus basilensis]MDF3835640.1 cupredoxin family copper-binding protein [Cupriavidus basilensis]